jgi:hypothetical protein
VRGVKEQSAGEGVGLKARNTFPWSPLMNMEIGSPPPPVASTGFAVVFLQLSLLLLESFSFLFSLSLLSEDRQVKLIRSCKNNDWIQPQQTELSPAACFLRW